MTLKNGDWLFTVSLEPNANGYRDIYWCWINNEPFFNETRDRDGVRKPYCSSCDHFIEDVEDRHEFLRHLKVVKSGWETRP